MKKVLIIGAKKSGVYAALLAKKNGFLPFVSENSGGEEFEQFVKILRKNGIDYELNGHSYDRISEFDLAVISPGVSLSSEIVKKIKAKNVPIIGEMEFAFRNAPSTKIVAITGTNGKSTTTALTGNIFKYSSFDTVVGGNLGTPYSELLFNNPSPDVAVLEASCFQLETIETYHPHIAVFLNFSEDHLNRYKNMDEYLYYKKRIFENQTNQDFAVLNYDDPLVRSFEKEIKSRAYFFSLNNEVERGIFIRDGMFVFKDNGKEENVSDINSVKLRGTHNLQNALASILSAKLMGIGNDVLTKGVETFTGLEHRLEEVRTINGVLYVNDSKATTPDSTIKALEAFNEPVVLIAGGSSKNNDFTELSKRLNGKVRKLILIGETAADIANSALETGYSDIVFATDLKDAVLLSEKIAKPGDVVLLSPACASFDMFKDFEDRGEQFKKIVNSL